MNVTELRDRFAKTDDVEVPDVWREIEGRIERISVGDTPRFDGRSGSGRRIRAAIVALVVFVAAGSFAWNALRPRRVGISTAESPGSQTAPDWLVSLASRMAASNDDPSPTSAMWVLTDSKTAAPAVGLTSDQANGTPEYLVVLKGEFTAYQAKIDGAAIPTGTTLVFTADPQTHQVLDWGVGYEHVDVAGLKPFAIASDVEPSSWLKIEIPIVIQPDGETFSLPPPGAVPRLSPEQAIRAFERVDRAFRMPTDATVWLGSYTAPVGDGTYRFRDVLAWGIKYHQCIRSANPNVPPPSPGGECVSWIFLNANTGRMLEGLAQVELATAPTVSPTAGTVQDAVFVCPNLAGTRVTNHGARSAEAAALSFVQASNAGDLTTIQALSDPAAAGNGLAHGLRSSASDPVSASGPATSDPIVNGSCGHSVAARTWRVTIDDGTSSASLDVWLYLIHRSNGWKIWGAY